MIDWCKEWGLNGLGGLYAFELSLEPPQEEAPEYLGSQTKKKGCRIGCSWNCLMLCRISQKNWCVFVCSIRGSCFDWCIVMQYKDVYSGNGQFLLSMKHCRAFPEKERSLGLKRMRIKNSLSGSCCDRVAQRSSSTRLPDQPFETLISWRPLPDRLPQLAAVPVKKLERDYLLKADVQSKILHIISHYCKIQSVSVILFCRKSPLLQWYFPYCAFINWLEKKGACFCRWFSKTKL